MSQVVSVENRNGVEVSIYDNGMERANGRIIKPPSTNVITAENARDFHRMRKEKKRAIAIEAANGAVSKAEYIEKYGEMAFVAGAVHSAMVKAQNPKDPKQIEAARFVFSETGVSEVMSDPDNGAGAGAPRVLVLLAELTRRADDEAIDADSSQVVRTSIVATNNEGDKR
jgi:hypothetical protein